MKKDLASMTRKVPVTVVACLMVVWRKELGLHLEAAINLK